MNKLENENIEEKEEIKNNSNCECDCKQEETNPLTQELEETTDRLKRVMAEFENYKKRESKEREMLHKTVLSDIVSSLLPIIDNLEHATNAELTENSGYKQGVELVLKQFLDVLKSFNVTQIETVGKTFDPELHEAVSSVEDSNLGEKEIKEEFRKGYIIGEKVIRHSMVVVAN